MAWRFHGKASVDSDAPRAFGVCDRCCRWFNLVDLRFQHDWRGNRLTNLYLRVCDQCYDKPFEHYRPIIIPPDPVPVWMPRPDQYAPFLPFLITATNGTQIIDQNGAAVMATSQLGPSAASNAGPKPTGLTTPQAIDGYEITAPTGGPVILIPD